MKPLFAVLFACFGASALANAPGQSDWRQACPVFTEACRPTHTKQTTLIQMKRLRMMRTKDSMMKV